MALARMGSLNVLEQSKGSYFWRRWLGHSLPSADTIGRVFAKLDCEGIREVLRRIYSRMKRNKALKPFFHGFFALIIDGHEQSGSYLRCCDGCLQRVISTAQGEKIQYYHRNVMALLLCKDFTLLLDIEQQQKGEDEVAAAERLLKRVIRNYPRAFNLILVDGLYVRANFFKLALNNGKDVIAVLKDNRRDLLKDVYGLIGIQEPKVYQCGKTTRKCWDIEELSSWTQIDRQVRVVRCLETTTICRQMSGEKHEQRAEWIWVSTISKKRLPTEAFVNLGHMRWIIENNGFNELVTYWHADHIYRHNPVAIEAFWLLTMLAYNLFHAFIRLNLKPDIRYKHSKLYWAMLIASEVYYLEASCSLPP